MEHEQLQPLALDFDALTAQAARIVLTVGQDPHAQGMRNSRATVALAERLGLPVHEMPGGHVGYLTHPTEFAGALIKTLAGER